MGNSSTYIFSYLAAAGAAAALTPLAIRLARAAGIVDLPNARKVHAVPTPRTGGLAVAGALLAAAVPALLLSGAFPPGGDVAPAHLLAVLAAALFLLAVGVVDDVASVPSKYKLLAIFAAALAVCASGARITDLGFGAGFDNKLRLGWASWPLTALWIVGVTVSINFIDGLDGLAGGIAGVACVLLAAGAAAGGQVALAVLSLALLGGLTGFLVYNVNPAKVFLGDCGSMFVGFTLASCSVMSARTVGTTGGLLLPGLALAVPFADAFLTVVRRGVLHRRSLFAAERGHIHHRLLDVGLCHAHAALVLVGVTAVAGVVGLIGLFGGRWTLVGGLSCFALVLAGLFKFSGSVQARQTVSAIRRNRALGRERGVYRQAFEEAQTRLRAADSFAGWWAEVCTAAEKMDFASLTLPLVNRDGTDRLLRWRRTDSQFGGCEVVRAALPVRHRRNGQRVDAHVEVPVQTVLESAGNRLALFARLLGEHSLADLPDRPGTPGPAAEESPAPTAEADIGLDPDGLAAVVGELERRKGANLAPAGGRPPRVAVVHDFLYTYAGAERVLEQVLNVFPDADLFSLFDFLPPGGRGFIRNKKVRTSFLQRMPLARQKHRGYLPLMPLAVEQLDVSGYDIVISSSYVVAKGVITRPGQLHVSYCHSPVRFAWDLQHQYLEEAGMARGVKSLLARAVLHYIRNWDVRSAAGVDVFVTNSQFVSGRVSKFYRRPSHVIYPPVDVDGFNVGTEREDYYLTASRMVPYKRIDLIVEAFSKMPGRRLIVAGDGPDFEKIKAKVGPNVRLVGHVPDEKLRAYMKRAKAFVFAAEEDFGIVPVEAQACGTPVVAYGRGGVTESVLDGRTGVFFGDQTAESIAAAVDRADGIAWDPAFIRRNAERFAAGRFRDQFRELVETEWTKFVARNVMKVEHAQLNFSSNFDKARGEEEKAVIGHI